MRYNFSVLCRQRTSGLKMNLELLNNSGEVIGDATLKPSGGVNEWKKKPLVLMQPTPQLKGNSKFLLKAVELSILI